MSRDQINSIVTFTHFVFRFVYIHYTSNPNIWVSENFYTGQEYRRERNNENKTLKPIYHQYTCRSRWYWYGFRPFLFLNCGVLYLNINCIYLVKLMNSIRSIQSSMGGKSDIVHLFIYLTYRKICMSFIPVLFAIWWIYFDERVYSRIYSTN